MEKREINSFRERRMETLGLITYTIHQLFMFVGKIMGNGNQWISLAMLFLMIASWVVYFQGGIKFKSRVLFTIISVELSVFLYSLESFDFFTIIVPFLAIVVLSGLYGISSVLPVSYLIFTGIILYHYFELHSFDLHSPKDFYHYAIPIINVYTVIFFVQFWVVQREKASEITMNIIKDLQSAELSKDDFMANVSHEIRTPINTISGMSEVILREELPEHIREKILDIQTSGRNLLSVVNDILDFSELQSGKQSVVEVSYNITSTINDVINMASAWKVDKNIEFIVDCDTTIPKGLVGDEQKIRRVILGLVNNAIKFTNDGCVTLQVSYRKEKYGVNLIVSVRDTGIGIDEAHQEKLFHSFSQVDTRRNRQEGGVGLGLAIAQALVERMNGYLSVKSQFGKGSEFQFVVPQKIDEPEAIISLGNTGHKFNILIYINMEQFDMMAIRDEYTNMIIHMTTQLNVRFHMCRNLAEFKRRSEREVYSHAFISFHEYHENPEYFDQLTGRLKVVTIVDDYQEKEIKNKQIFCIYKPFYVLSVIQILSGANSRTRSKRVIRDCHFIAPTAKILAVDDNIINLKVLRGILKPYKITVENALSGAEALDKIDSRDYDLIFMDHMMPEMDGIECLHRIRNKKGMYFKEIPIIALTANAVAGAREMFLSEGFQDFVAKPMEISVLERSLLSFLPEDKIEYVEDKVKAKVEPLVEVKAEPPVEPKAEVKTEAIVEPKVEVKPEVKIESTVSSNQNIVDIDEEQGITYCGSREDFLEILEMHYDDGPENQEKIQKFYEEKDWKNYTILVHGLKSSMKTVGIMKLSEMARLLEAAGKTSDEAYILANHQEMMVEYKRILGVLGERFGGKEEEIKEELNLEVLPDEKMDEMLVAFEDAVYTWEGDNMQTILEQMQEYQYHGVALKDPLQAIQKKIEMSDYMSALDTLKSFVEKWKKG